MLCTKQAGPDLSIVEEGRRQEGAMVAWSLQKSYCPRLPGPSRTGIKYNFHVLI